MRQRELSAFLKALNTIRDPDGTGRTRVTQTFEGRTTVLHEGKGNPVSRAKKPRRPTK